MRAILPKPHSMPPVMPETPFIAIGDIHGRADLLSRCLDRCAEQAPDYQIVCVGDYVDRGDASAEVLRMLHGRDDIVCLSGNHEEMMIRFIAAPEENGSRWLRYGGLQTLASFGVTDVRETSRGDDLIRARDQLCNAMGDSVLRWVQGLPDRWQTGNIAVVHAAADPERTIADQETPCLHWGHEKFVNYPRTDGTWIVHGHTIVDCAGAEKGRISIDTGAYATGRLTAVHIDENGMRFDVTAG